MMLGTTNIKNKIKLSNPNLEAVGLSRIMPPTDQTALELSKMTVIFKKTNVGTILSQHLQ